MELVFEILSYAKMAPSADNSQPGKYRLRDDGFTVNYAADRVAGKTFEPMAPATLLAMGAIQENISQGAAGPPTMQRKLNTSRLVARTTSRFQAPIKPGWKRFSTATPIAMATAGRACLMSWRRPLHRVVRVPPEYYGRKEAESPFWPGWCKGPQKIDFGRRCCTSG